jgi:hypothetical protein
MLPRRGHLSTPGGHGRRRDTSGSGRIWAPWAQRGDGRGKTQRKMEHIPGREVGGIAVCTGAQLAALADPGAIRVSRTLRGLVADAPVGLESREAPVQRDNPNSSNRSQRHSGIPIQGLSRAYPRIPRSNHGGRERVG